MKMKKAKGLLVVVSGPSGAGKGTICKDFLEKNKEAFLSISATTRKPRPGEVHGTHYYFLEEDNFKQMINEGGFIEWAQFCENYYGTPKKAVTEKLESGNDVILEIEVQGAMKVKEAFPEAVLVFVLPPSMSVLRERLTGRGTETPEVIEKRLNTALWELTIAEKYDYILINDDVTAASKRLEGIIKAEKQSVKRNNEFLKEFTQN
ncbi:MAG: guanylate kinase [Clostridia bacterium]|nr:guanylate kinase [Clostridia bacterium]